MNGAPRLDETYDILAPRYDNWSGRVVPELRIEWARKVDAFVDDGELVVELGCGTGAPVGKLLSARYGYTGIDASAGMLARARAALPAVTLTQADMYSVDFAAESLGAVVSFYSISHTPRELHAGLFTSIAAWLRPGGVFVGNLHSVDDPDGYDANWLGAGPMRWSGYDGATNLGLLRAAGFEIVESAPITQTEPDGSTICPLWFITRCSSVRARGGI